MKPRTSQIQPGLYLVATPIGNLGDITLRALEVLKAADLIVCEDTRVTAKLLNAYGIDKPTLSYNDHNGAERRPKILKDLKEGKCIALVSDAGTPLISDPGYKLLREVQAENIYVTALPGASSVLAGLSLSGLPTDRFFFAGFLPAKQEACRKEIKALAQIPSTLVLFESARRLPDTLEILAEVLGDREAAVVREISKLYEESRRGTLPELKDHYAREGAPKGEVVLVIGPPLQEAASETDLSAALAQLMQSHSLKEAVALVAEHSGAPKRDVYALALKLAGNHEG